MKAYLHKKVPHSFKKVSHRQTEKQATIFIGMNRKKKKNVVEDVEYEVVECEVAPAKIVCPDCGGITLEGLDYCDKCGGELKESDK